MNRHPELERFLGEGSAADRAQTLEHVRTCRECLAEVAERDPSRVFGLLASEPVPEHVLARVSAGVSEAIDAESDDRTGTTPRGAIATFGPIAASVLLAGLLGAYLWMERPAAPPADVVRAPVVETGVGMDEPGPIAPAGPASVVDVISSPGTAEVLDLSVGETQLVMIFDENLDI
jgi:anti-sigma factor RsiW